MWHVYISDREGQLYTGITTDLSHRMKQHGATLLFSQDFESKHAAVRREKEIKGRRFDKKMALIRRSR
jgi:predicted GIY-YIG superfamily endonuclease